MGAYREAAWTAWEAGFNPIPLGKGNTPIAGWKEFQNARMTRADVERLRIDRMHAQAGIGTTTGGATGLILVDVDPADPADPGLLNEMIARFGPTPAMVTTPRGGTHLWYRAPGPVHIKDGLVLEPTPHGKDNRVDLKADRGFGRLPPTPREGTEGFRWAPGSGWEALGDVPTPRPGAIPPELLGGPRKALSVPPSAVQPGGRNRALYDHLRAFAASCDDEAEIAAEALRWNAELPEPLPVNEALKVAGSVSRYKATGSLLVPGGERMVALQVTALKRLSPDAFYLLAQLRHEHAGLRQEFAISPPAMAASLGWRKPRFMAARDELVTAGYLVRTHQGGAGKHDPARFRFAP